jgi:hypothetical protein
MFQDTPEGQTHHDPKVEDLKLCPSCNTMKHFSGEKCARCLDLKKECPYHEQDGLDVCNCERTDKIREEAWWINKKYWMNGNLPHDLLSYVIPRIIAEAERRERERIDQKIRTDISTALATAERNIDAFDPKHPRCPKCGKLMAEMEPNIWMCACSPLTRLSIG